MFLIVPAHNNFYGSRRPHANNYRVTPREQYLSAAAATRSAEAAYLAALAREEVAQRHFESLREEAFLDALYGQEQSYAYPRRDLHRTSYGRRFPLDFYADEDGFSTEEVDLRLHLQELESRKRQQQMEEQRRLAHLRLTEERSQRRAECLRRCRQRSWDDTVDGSQEEDAIEAILSLIFGIVPESTPSQTNLRRACHIRRPCGLKQCHSEPELRTCPGRSRCPVVGQAQPESCSPCGPSSRPVPDLKRPCGARGVVPNSSEPEPTRSKPADKVPEKPTPAQEKSHTGRQGDGEVNVGNAIRSFLTALADSAKVPNPSSAAAPSSTSATSLKEQLEARLYRDPDVEIRDTIQAIMASLATTAPKTSQAPAPSAKDAAPVSGKGKEKVVKFNIPVSTPTSDDVAHALDTVRNVEASFFALETDFVFPKTLDLSVDVVLTLPAKRDNDADSDTSSVSLDRKLAYTARNAPVRYYEHALCSLLSQLDAVDSYGSEMVRSRRREVVERVEKALKEVEREVEIRVERAEKLKESTTASTPPPTDEQTEANEQPTQVATPPVVVTERGGDVVAVDTISPADNVLPSNTALDVAVNDSELLDGRESAGATEAPGIETPTPSLASTAADLSPILETPVGLPEIGESTTVVDAIAPPEVDNVGTSLVPASPPSLSESAYPPLLLDNQSKARSDAGSDEDAWLEVEA